MKIHPALATLIVLLLVPAGFAATPVVGDAKAELSALVAQINAKLKAGPHTANALADEIRQFDALLTAHAGEKTDAVAQILYMKATLYTDIIHDDVTGLPLLRQVQADFPASAAAKRAAGLLARLTGEFAVGRPFPAFAVRDLDGHALSPANFKGKVVLVDFWAMWCAPCVKELPNVVQAYQKFHAAGFEIIGVSLDRQGDRARLVEFTRAHDMPWPQFFDGRYWQNQLAVQYGVHSIPATFLIDREGNIAAINLRGPALEAKLAALLGPPAPVSLTIPISVGGREVFVELPGSKAEVRPAAAAAGR
jgi:peroxiredoxin